MVSNHIVFKKRRVDWDDRKEGNKVTKEVKYGEMLAEGLGL